MQETSALEESRRLIEACENMTGELYDYLDRGMPSPEQESRTWEVLKQLESMLGKCRPELEQTIRDTLVRNGNTVSAWAKKHMTICDEVLAGVREGLSRYPDPELEALIAERLKREWALVAEGEVNCVVQHKLMLQYHRKLYDREFGQISDPRQLLPDPPWESE
jgi:hypothetical protein